MSSKDQYYVDNPSLIKEVTVTILTISVLLFGLNYMFWSAPAHSQEENLEETTDTQNQVQLKEIISISLVVNTETDIYIMQQDIPTGSTVLDLMQEAAEKNDFTFRHSEGPAGTRVDEIYGVRANATNGSWTYTINDQPGPQSISSYELQDRDSVSWRLSNL